MTATIYEWPTDWYRFISTTFRLQAKSQITPRTWIGGKSVYGPHAQLWVAQLSLPAMRWDERGQAMAAFFSRLDGQANLIRIGHFPRLKPQFNRSDPAVATFSDGTFFNNGTGWSSGMVPDLATFSAAALRGDNSITIAGLQHSVTRVLRRGDLCEGRAGGTATATPNLYEIQADATSDSSGLATVEIRPRLRQNFAAGDTIAFANPTSVFRLADDDQGAAQVDFPNLASIGFNLVEAIV